MQASVTDNSQLAWQHAHPFLMVAFSTLGTLAVLTGILLVRWLVLRKAWRHHPRGALGFLRDDMVRWGVALLPLILLFILIKTIIFLYYPAYNRPQTWVLFGVIAIAYRLAVARLGWFRGFGASVDQAIGAAKARS